MYNWLCCGKCVARYPWPMFSVKQVVYARPQSNPAQLIPDLTELHWHCQVVFLIPKLIKGTGYIH